MIFYQNIKCFKLKLIGVGISTMPFRRLYNIFGWLYIKTTIFYKNGNVSLKEVWFGPLPIYRFKYRTG